MVLALLPSQGLTSEVRLDSPRLLPLIGFPDNFATCLITPLLQIASCIMINARGEDLAQMGSRNLKPLRSRKDRYEFVFLHFSFHSGPCFTGTAL